MSDLREIIAENIAALRQENNLTQLALAERLNYSDKAVSKWERAESVPDVSVLKSIADLFGVSVDYLLTDDHTAFRAEKKEEKTLDRKNHALITFLAFGLVWMLATYLFVQLSVLNIGGGFPLWLFFLYAVPASVVVLLIFNCIWGRRAWNPWIVSILLWSVLAAVFLSFVALAPEAGGIWMVFLLGVPAEYLILLWMGLLAGKRKTKEKKGKK